jgi:hypothetical protein
MGVWVQIIEVIVGLIMALAAIAQILDYAERRKERNGPPPGPEAEPPTTTEEEGIPPPPEPPVADSPYIGNRDSKVFHRAGCSSVGQMSAHNRRGFGTPQEATDLGFRPCGRCKP